MEPPSTSGPVSENGGGIEDVFSGGDRERVEGLNGLEKIMDKIPLEHSKVKVVLVDIEGTVCPISFVKETLFPYFVQELPRTLEQFWDSPTLRPFIMAFPEEQRKTEADLYSYCVDLVAKDIKDPALKALQGHVWKSGYSDGKLKVELFQDVADCFYKWVDAGIKIVVYSSGSIPAQKLLFGHTSGLKSDLNPILSGYHDTTTAGLKGDPESYNKIYNSSFVGDTEVITKDSWLFLSDNVQEVDAALASGMLSAVVVREGNAPLSPEDLASHDIIQNFGELEIPGKGFLSPLLTDQYLKILNRNIEIYKLPFSSGHYTLPELNHAAKIVAASRKLRKLLDEDVNPQQKQDEVPLLEDSDPAVVGDLSGKLGVKRKEPWGTEELDGAESLPKRQK